MGEEDEEVERIRKRTGNRGYITCKRCGPPYAITWRESRQGYARLVASGVAEEAAKVLLPMCVDCVGAVLAGIGKPKWPRRRGR